MTSLDGVQHRGSVLEVCLELDFDLHGEVFNMDTDKSMDTWGMGMGTSRKQLIRFCTWRDARLERAMP